MAEVRSIGIKTLKMGDIGAGGVMGTALNSIGVTYKDSAELEQEEGEITEIYSEENDDPEEIILSKGKTTLKWQIMDYEPDVLVKVLGGTSADGVWKAPSSAVDIEQSIEIESKTGIKIRIIRAKIIASLSAKLSKSGVALVNITAKVLTPINGTAPIEIEKPA